MRQHILRFVAVGVATGLIGSATSADAATIIRDPNPPKYGVEIEPKFNIGFLNPFGNYGGNNYGPGVRFSIPIVSPGFIKKLNNNVAISFGADMLYYEGYAGYYYNGFCGGRRDCLAYYGAYNYSFWALHLPVTMQWNFFITDKWSVFGEPGLTLRYAFYHDYPYDPRYCDPRFYNCSNPYGNRLTPYFTFFAGGRFHFSEKVALTMRLGYPIDLSVGVSFFL